MTPRVALTLALALHELTTNAAKYGALSVPAGRIEVRWQIERRPSQRRCCGSNGASAAARRSTAPARQGFGTRFIEGSVASELQGTAQAGLRSRQGWSARWKFRSMRSTPDIDGVTRSGVYATPPR